MIRQAAVAGQFYNASPEVLRADVARYSDASATPQAATSAHQFEHCLEVQLPFLRQARADVRIVPIVLGTTREEVCRDLGLCLAEIIEAHAAQRSRSARPLLIASTDMSHYEPDSVTREKDRFALEAI